MKKTLLALISVIFVFLCVGCGGPDKGYLTGNETIDAYLELPIGSSPEDAIKILGDPYREPETYDLESHFETYYIWLYEDEENYTFLSAGYRMGLSLTRKLVNLSDLKDDGFTPRKSVSLEQVNELRNRMTLDKTSGSISTYKDGLSYDEVVSILGIEGLYTQMLLDLEEDLTITEYRWLVEDHPSDLAITFYNGNVHSVEV